MGMGKKCPQADRASFEARLGAAVDYLEDRLDGDRGPADAEGAARAAGWSKWHFMRLFQAASGMAVAEYVHARRLSRASRALAASSASVLDVALETGYDSQAAFARAFRRTFGLAPSDYRKAARAGKAPPLALTEPFEPRLPFEPQDAHGRIVELPELDLVGVGTRASIRAYASFSELPRFWDDWFRSRRWREVPDSPPDRPVYGLCGPAVDAEFEYLICVESPPKCAAPPRWRRIKAPAGRYAVFEASGSQPRAIQEATLAAYLRWLPVSNLARGDGWDMEVYYPGPSGRPRRAELRLPLAGA